MKLKLGIMKIKELAEWFGVKPNTFSKNKDKKLEELKRFCDFEVLETGKINITKILIDEYTKKDVYELIRDSFDDDYWNEYGVNTYKNMQIKIKRDFNLSEDTSKEYLNRVLDELYGFPHSTEKCFLAWSKEVNDKLIPLSEEEEKLRNEINHKYSDKYNEAYVNTYLDRMVFKLSNLDTWKDFENRTREIDMKSRSEFQIKVGYIVIPCLRRKK